MEKILIVITLFTSVFAFSWSIDGSKEIYDGLFKYSKHELFDCNLISYKDEKVGILTLVQKTSGQRSNIIFSKNDKIIYKKDVSYLKISRRINSSTRDYSENLLITKDKYGIVQFRFSEFVTKPIKIIKEITCKRR